jgi:hypothetical protein
VTDSSPRRPPASQRVQYKGGDLEPARGPGLGCFWIQVVVLLVAVVLTPLSVSTGMASWVTIVLFVVTLVLLFFVGQTLIFLLRIVAAERGEGRRRPRASRSLTVGELEDQAPAPTADPQPVSSEEGAAAIDDALPPEPPAGDPDRPSDSMPGG